jgi:hypothetical protein
MPRWNLKAAEGKALTRLIDITEKVITVGREENIFKA